MATKAVFNATPRVSAFIACYKAGEDPDALVGSFSAIGYANKELILAIGGGLNIADYAHLAGPGVILLEHPGGRKNNAYRRALEHATGEVLYLSDADCRFESDNFLRLIAPIANGEEQATVGPSRPPDGYKAPLFVDLLLAFRLIGPPVLTHNTRMFSGRNSAVARKALEAAGGFDLDALGEDYFLGARLQQAGYRVANVPGTMNVSSDPVTAGAYIRQQVRWARSELVDAPRLGRYKDALHGLRFALIGAGMLAITLSLPFTGRTGLLIFLPLITYAYTARLVRMVVATRTREERVRPLHLLAPFLFAYLEFFIWTRALVEALIPPLRRRW
ncbi:MAG TPA: glycosyltransferase family 2 protein [Dehalococcoidia bacterium]|nr:glycosyltransferase family 2 protein [Dehalococcoidia bacterium]